MPLSPKRQAELALRRCRRRDFLRDWDRSKKGNLWREFDGLILTIFESKFDIGYSYCIANNNEVTFSQEYYRSEDAAKQALAKRLLGGER